MKTLKELVQSFLAQKRIAVVGVSAKRETGCNLIYEKLKKHGYQVSAVSPHLTEFKGDPCYPDLRSIPEKPDAVFVMTNPSVSLQVVQQCVDLGIGNIWFHCLMGTKRGLMKSATSVSDRAVDLALAHGMTVIPGTCPAQFLDPDPAHRFMRSLFSFLGFHRLPAELMTQQKATAV